MAYFKNRIRPSTADAPNISKAASMNRDLLVLNKQIHLSEDALAKETALLNQVLMKLENWESFCIANEVIDINRRKMIRKAHLVRSILQDHPNKSFIFVCNKN